MNKKSVMSVLVGMILASSISQSWAGGIYRWVDEKGVTHFGEKPPAPGVGEKVRVNAPNPSSSPKQDPGTGGGAPTTPAEKPSTPTIDPAAAKAQAEVIKQNCEIHRSNLKILRENARIRETGADGQVKMLGDEEKQAKIKEAEKYLSDNCQGTAAKTP